LLEVSSPPANEVEEYFRRMDLKEVNSGSVLGENLKSESIQNLDDSSPVPSSLEKNEVASLDHNGNIDILNTGSQSTTFPLVTNTSDDDEQLSLNEEMIIIPKEIQPSATFGDSTESSLKVPLSKSSSSDATNILTSDDWDTWE